MRQDIAKQTKMREVLQKKLHQMEDQKADVDVQREILKARIAGVEKGTGGVFYVSAARDSIGGPGSNMGAAAPRLEPGLGVQTGGGSPKSNRKYILGSPNPNI